MNKTDIMNLGIILFNIVVVIIVIVIVKDQIINLRISLNNILLTILS